MLNQVLQEAALVTAGAKSDITVDDLGVSPNWNFPVIGWLREMVGGFWAIGFLVLFFLLILGVIMFVGGRVAGSNRAGQVGIGAVVIGLVGVILIGGIASYIAWGANQKVLGLGTGDTPSQVQVVAQGAGEVAPFGLG